MGYLGKQPALQASEYREEFNITSTTTNIITSGYVRTGSSNYLEVYRNGVLLGKADYTLQSDYKTIVLTNAAVAGDIVVVLGRRNLTQGLKVAERRHEHVIQNGETTVTFPFPLTADITDVYINGVKLWYGDGSGDGSNSDYAINPVTRVISFGLNPSVGDTVSIVSREPTSVSSTPLPLIDSNGASVISENGGVISLSADTAEVSGIASLGVNENDYINARGGNGTARVEAVGTNTNVNLSLATKGSGSFYFWSGGYGGAERMRIHEGGEITMPYQPICSATHGLSVSLSNVELDSSNFYDTIWVNRGGHFNSSTGKFTCPVAGVYRIYFRATGTGSSNVRLRKNGVTVNEAFEQAGTNHSVSSEAVVSCVAGDYLNIQVYSLSAIGGTQHKQVTFELIS